MYISKTKVFIEAATLTDYMNRASALVVRDADQEVFWLDITMDQRLVVDRLYATDLHNGNVG